MFSKLTVNSHTPCIEGLPDGWQTIFLASIAGMFGPSDFLAIICPKASIPQANSPSAIIIDAHVVFFNRDRTVLALKAKACSKNGPDTFVVSWDWQGNCWRILKQADRYAFTGMLIPPQRVFSSFC
ncbi:MAG: hypothetical protein UT41_C0002G0167 [Candidatus Wolfebacteria bacterium GW2011_GWC2_39_22]|uniref:Uncharacterized protein n=2 Tax=Candidatus Wolfeibacteriota TaxID=1752735 RepID=A0A0G1H7E5_9BACT|nr:MAG: hypothetical protein UT41_C0002G0167 [Candidatus Wolfebacteria bacterium GW2011_GWC2_39_22]KKT43301.1 MAG: hypothetical protein UW32_C0002G0162 [Candidatus Wolfebacteria bacterium GW2011_GWE2_44_13]HBI26020.1 hypothetical protein [Candidatus Wolfebacteria bacterium]